MVYKVMIIDDEPLALRRMEHLIEREADCQLLGSFLYTEDALKSIQSDPPDLIFLDIEMPEINGITFATHLRKISPHTEIVFVTAHSEYAVEAFGLEALDYLVKPIAHERLAETWQRLRKRVAAPPYYPDTKPQFHMQCLGRLQLFDTDGSPIELKWRTAKIRELFAYLFHNRNEVVGRDHLLQLFWPELDERRGIANLQTSIYRIRKLLTDHNLDQSFALNLLQHGYSLEISNVTVDVEQWEQSLHRLEPIALHNCSMHDELFLQYQGSYHAGSEYYWAEHERRRLQSLWLQHALTLGQYYMEHGPSNHALNVYHRIVQLDPLNEEAHWALMRIYDQLRDIKSVQLQYQYMAQLLRSEADVAPDQEITAWYEERGLVKI